jgi:hypothetical protein
MFRPRKCEDKIPKEHASVTKPIVPARVYRLDPSATFPEIPQVGHLKAVVSSELELGKTTASTYRRKQCIDQ